MTPRATYRLQFNRDFDFADAAALVPYLAALGISHLYASPWLKARAGSRHGYDIIDHAAFNPELGGEAGFERLHAALEQHGLGHILDFVPNHMAVAQADNPWWLDVLEWGRASPYADWFDIDWSPPDPALRNKLLLPFLGGHYGAVLEAGELEPRFDPESGTFSVCYFEHRFPLAPWTFAALIRAAATRCGDVAEALEAHARAFDRLRLRAGAGPRVAQRVRERAAELKARLAGETHLHEALQRGAAAFAVRPDETGTWRPLHDLLERQAYRLAYWRVAADEINYRRFFDINGLAALRVENREVFDHIHALVARLLDAGKLDGLRIDHLDGLHDPARYCQRLRRLTRRPFYVVVEKILAHDERLRENWPVEGTTGYQFLNQVTRLLVGAHAGRALTHTYTRFTGISADFDATLYVARKQILHTRLSGELHVLARQLQRIARRHPRSRDYTLQGLTLALAEVIAAFPVYRSYVDAHGASADDRADIARAVDGARRRWDQPGGDIFDFIEAALTTDLAARPDYGRRRVLRFAMQFQQYTSPVMAKGFEDTALYRYHRLDALNEVGGDPRQFGMSVAAFHHANRERARHWPQALLATASHDTKRGEDVRARLAALPAVAPDWDRAVRHWARLNRRWKQPLNGRLAPDRNDEYLLYQTLIGAWPVELMDSTPDPAVAADFCGRVQAYMTKALREAKLNSSWTDPDAGYEAATARFIARILDPESGAEFLEVFAPLQQRVAEFGIDNSLVQLALKLTCPGVPDIYQGCELWDLNLVDPDNRRPVDFERRAMLLARVQGWDALPPAQRLDRLEAWRRHWHDGAIKLHLLRRLLALRAARPRLFAQGDYRPLPTPGIDADAAIAFERVHGEQRCVVAAILRPHDAGISAAALRRIAAIDDAVGVTDVLGAAGAGAETASGQPRQLPLPVAVWMRATGTG